MKCTMSKFEKNLCDFVCKQNHILFFIAITLIGLVIRIYGIGFLSEDMNSSLIPWFNEIKNNGGLKGLGTQVGDYNLLYQTIIAFMTKININCVYLYKILSFIFDYLLAFLVAHIAAELCGEKKFSFWYNVTYAIILFLPTVVFNSAYWGQCDSIYTFFAVATLYYLYKEKSVLSFIFLGVGFAFKLQMVFILPFILCYYLYSKRFSILMFFISGFTFWFSGIIAYLNGRNLLAAFSVYANQAGEYPGMTLNNNNFWIIAGQDYQHLNKFAIMLAVVLCGLGLYFILNKVTSFDLQQFFSMATWFVWTMVLFLPSMHERYTYILDILLIILCIKDRKFIYCAVVSCIINTVTYSKFLFTGEDVNLYFAIANVLAWVYFTYKVIKAQNSENKVNIC